MINRKHCSHFLGKRERDGERGEGERQSTAGHAQNSNDSQGKKPPHWQRKKQNNKKKKQQIIFLVYNNNFTHDLHEGGPISGAGSTVNIAD